VTSISRRALNTWMNVIHGGSDFGKSAFAKLPMTCKYRPYNLGKALQGKITDSSYTV